MLSKVLELERFRIRVQPGWDRHDPPHAKCALFLRRSGELQEEFEVSLFSAGKGKVFVGTNGRRLWKASGLLLRLSLRQGQLSGWSSPFDREMYNKALTWGAASFQDGDRFIRVWHVAGDQAIALISFRCEWDHHETTAKHCLPMVRSFRWRLPRP